MPGSLQLQRRSCVCLCCSETLPSAALQKPRQYLEAGDVSEAQSRLFFWTAIQHVLLLVAACHWQIFGTIQAKSTPGSVGKV